MSDTDNRPRGIRNNNPGNLRNAYGSDKPVKRMDGFAVFDTLHDGLVSLCCLTFDYYAHLDCKTPKEFVLRYAPPTENNALTYIQNACGFAGIPPKSSDIWDLRLHRPGFAWRWIMAIAICENGQAPPAERWCPLWWSPAELVIAMRDSGKWQM